jgi:citrate lyase subunit gamma (acyl carrier protein)
MEVKEISVAGTLESSDVQIILKPNPGGGLAVDLESDVKAIFGDAILETVYQVCREMEVTEAAIEIHDKGAFDHVIRARLIAAILRAAKRDQVDWERM